MYGLVVMLTIPRSSPMFLINKKMKHLLALKVEYAIDYRCQPASTTVIQEAYRDIARDPTLIQLSLERQKKNCKPKNV